MKLGIMVIIILTISLFGCRATPMGYSIYNKVVMDEPGKLTFADDASTYTYTYLNGTAIKVILIGIEVPSDNRCEQLWKMQGISYVQDNIIGRVVTLDFVKDNQVYISDEEGDVGLTLIKEGYAKAKEGNYSKYDDYVAAQDYAKSSKNGIWGCK